MRPERLSPSGRLPQSDRTGIVDRGLDRLSFLLDRAIRIPGTNIRFGLDPIIGLLLPAAGDFVAAGLSAYIVLAAVRYGLPKVVIGRMVFNVGMDYLIGTIPLIGELFDFAWKANTKNMELLQRHAAGSGRATFSDWLWVFFLLGILGVFMAGLLALAVLALRQV
ncbi:MAG TPA: DUF4112 domain-containing protein, partial [Blastocatellia bacterium]|nr:DUF4112 domain-containing protein [Blastocatellia bacterium]